MVSFDTVWRRIEAHAGAEFRQIRGGAFRYEVANSYIKPDRTNQQLPRTHFEQAFALVPLTSTAQVQHLRGPSYLYAILMDSRIRQSDW